MKAFASGDPASQGAPPGAGQTATSRRFIVAFSYAGEDRARVAPVAEAMAQRFGKERVLYDRFHQAEFARANLDVYLPPLYRDQSELIVVVLSHDYPRKAWCGLEIRWIRQLLLGADSGRIMLLSLGDPGDLSQLGILPGDGYLDIADLPDVTVSERIQERLSLQGVAIAGAANGTVVGAPGASASPLPLLGSGGPDGPASSRWPGSGRLRGLLGRVGGGRGLTALALMVPLVWFLGRPQVARWQVRQGDQAFIAFAQTQNPERLNQAGAAWKRAQQLDPGLAEAHARLGYYANFLGETEAAEAHWQQAIDREPPKTSAARSYRVGLANVLARQPARRKEAIAMFEAEVRQPRSAIELAMLRWPDPGELPQALDAVSHPDVAAALEGAGAESDVPWGFTMPQGEVLHFLSRGEQRCLLRNVKAATAHLIGTKASPPPLTSVECQGIRESVKELLCLRLRQASASNPRADATGRWLTCPTPAREAPGLGASTTS
jgi:tetratricopeptide (TPR) repeat protein